MFASIRFIVIVFVVLAIMAPWAMGPFIDGMSEFATTVGSILSETVKNMRDGV